MWPTADWRSWEDAGTYEVTPAWLFFLDTRCILLPSLSGGVRRESVRGCGHHARVQPHPGSPVSSLLMGCQVPPSSFKNSNKRRKMGGKNGQDIHEKMFHIISCCCSVTKSCLTLQPHGCITLSFPVLHYLLEFAQIHVHWVGDAIQTSPSLANREMQINDNFILTRMVIIKMNISKSWWVYGEMGALTDCYRECKMVQEL